ncbi:hypothetical protein CIB48_g7052 [Xylaria polymorpha]|nr:hypothetical protein CIB48_g7052 [Xylaria polymorpha]
MLIIDATTSVTENPLDQYDASVLDLENGEVMGVEGKGKTKASAMLDINEIIAASKTSSDAFMVDWTKYEPPECLRYTGDIESDMVAQIIQESIDRIKTRIREEEEQKSAAEEVRRRQEEVASQGNEEVRQSESDNPVHEDLGQVNELYQPATPGQAISAGGFPVELPKRPRKRTLMNLFRKMNSGPEHGESSTAGAARHRLLLSSSTAEFTTHLARKRFVLDLIKKATGEDSTSLDSSTPESEVECVSCLDDFNPKDTVRTPCHNYCHPCFRRLIASACQNEQHWPPKCCLNNIPENTIFANVDKAQRTEYRERAREWNVPMADRIYCSQPGCSLLIQPEYIILSQDLARCTDGHYTCITCRNPQHEGSICPQDKDMVRTNELAEEEGWKRCYGCHAYVEHREACQHMTCRCGAEFCYVCGARWRTCACTMAQLATLKEHAATRRQQRQDVEAAEDAAILEAIRLVAEFEREEALKAELLRQEQARVAEERRQAELEERIRREGERRRAATLKFEELRATFAALHGTQREMVVRNHARRERQLARKSEDVFRRLLEMHELERELQRAKVEARIAQREDAFRAEYVARVAEERQIEEHGRWGRPRGLEELGRWRARAYRHHVREELAAGEALMDEKEGRLRARACEAAVVLVRRNAAELAWVREVVEERARLLSELETDEIENGEDIDTWFAEGPLEEALAANPWQKSQTNILIKTHDAASNQETYRSPLICDRKRIIVMRRLQDLQFHVCYIQVIPPESTQYRPALLLMLSSSLNLDKPIIGSRAVKTTLQESRLRLQQQEWTRPLRDDLLSVFRRRGGRGNRNN